MKNTKKLITRALALLLVAASLFSLPLFSTSAPQTDLLSVSAEAGVVYYPRYTGKSGSIVDGLKAVGVDSSFNNRKSIAAVNGISNYSGTAAQNTAMLNLLKQGKLNKSKTPYTPADSNYAR